MLCADHTIDIWAACADFCLEVHQPSRTEEDLLSDLALGDSHTRLSQQQHTDGSNHPSDLSVASTVPESPFATLGRVAEGGEAASPSQRPTKEGSGEASENFAKAPLNSTLSGTLTAAFSAAQTSSMRSRRRAYEKRARRRKKQDYLLDLALCLYNLHRYEWQHKQLSC